MVIKVFQSLKKRSMPHVFEKLLNESFPKIYDNPPFVATEKLWSPSKK
jgi:hypothetical protein